MRVISGKARGLKLRAAEGLNTRPTADRIKENIFNMLAPDLPGCMFLDLFSGTGAIGIEALSRSAKFAVFVDNSPIAVETIKRNLDAAKLMCGARVICMDYKPALEQLAREKLKFDVIFLDPPYYTGFAPECLELIAGGGLLNDTGFVVAELEHGTKHCLNSYRFEIYKSRDYGAASIVFLRQAQEGVMA